ncbi:MAG: LPS export ABC transporter permease LptF [Gammaproteobacteria bacterium]|nr:LPS export ABC transporter permease LptF [Gammaproteobacteria bacterium]
MPNIITRYLTQEIIKSSSATVLVLFVILMSNALGRVLADITDGEVPQQALFPVLLSQAVSVFSLLLPVSFFLGIVFAFGRLYKDHEIVVMNACGMGCREFYRPVVIILIPLVIFSAYANIWLNAQIQHNAQKIVEREKNVYEFGQFKAGQFNQSSSGEKAFYMETISDDKLELSNVIISESGDDRLVLETAQTGRHRVDEETGDLFLVVGPGERYEGQPGTGNYNTISFEQHGILVEKKNVQSKRRADVEEKSPRQLWRSKNVRAMTELHWRISIPVVLIVLAFLAVPLSYMTPRQGRFGKVGYAFLAYLVYFNLLAFTRAQLEAKNIPLLINFWWVHLIFIMLAITLLLKRNGSGWLISKKVSS